MSALIYHNPSKFHKQEATQTTHDADVASGSNDSMATKSIDARDVIDSYVNQMGQTNYSDFQKIILGFFAGSAKIFVNMGYSFEVIPSPDDPEELTIRQVKPE